MNDSQLAFELLRLAKSIVAEMPTYNDHSGDLYRSLRSLVKSNNGLWKSEKQGKFILRKLASGFDKISPQLMKIIKKIRTPEGTRGIILTSTVYSGGGQFGRKSRVLDYAYWVDSHGIIQEAKLARKYYDKMGGGSELSGQIKKTWSRPASLGIEVDEEQAEDVKDWYKKNRKKVSLILKHLKDEPYHARVVGILETGMMIPDERDWNMALGEAMRRQKHKGEQPFPVREKVKIAGLELKVQRVKQTSKEYGYHMSDYYAFMGDIKGYPEFGYIQIGALSFEKWFDKKFGIPEGAYGPEIFEMIQKKIVGKTLILDGTFTSNGKMIFGSRVKVRGIK
jgi:hypothetical protein